MCKRECARELGVGFPSLQNWRSNSPYQEPGYSGDTHTLKKHSSSPLFAHYSNWLTFRYLLLHILWSSTLLIILIITLTYPSAHLLLNPFHSSTLVILIMITLTYLPASSASSLSFIHSTHWPSLNFLLTWYKASCLMAYLLRQEEVGRYVMSNLRRRDYWK